MSDEENVFNLEREKLLYDYVILSSRDYFENFSNFDYAFAELARKGSKLSLAKYFEEEKRENWKSDLVDMAKSIINKPDKRKSAEDWLVVALFHSQDEVELEGDLDVKTISDLKKKLYFDNEYMLYVEDEYDHRRASKVECKNAWDRLTKSHDLFVNSDYAKAVKEAQLSYYQRYFSEWDLMDAAIYLNLSKAPNCWLTDKDELANRSEGVYYNQENIFKLMGKVYKTLSKNGIFATDGYAYNKTLLEKTTSKRKQQNAESILWEISELRMFNESINSPFPEYELPDDVTKTY